MKQRKRLWTGLVAGIMMLIMILDAKTTLTGAQEGIQLCIQSVIPSLFPFLILSNLVNNALIGTQTAFSRPIRKLCAIPDGGESLLLLGLLGGYPIGAQAIASAYRSGKLSRKTAVRMLGFCNNAGPSFIFGLVGTLFTSSGIAWIIWFIHIASALAVGAILPNKRIEKCFIPKADPVSITKALEQSIKIIAIICGWVIAFRVIITVCNRWFVWLLPQNLQPLFIGILELTNGITALHAISSEGFRFVLSASMLSIGGICVGMQTRALTEGLALSVYFPGKILQCIISFFIASIVQIFIFAGSEIMHIKISVYIALLAVMLFMVLHLYRKKDSDKTAAVVV